MDVVDWMKIAMGIHPAIKFLQIPEKAESLEGKHWLFVRCWECRHLFHEDLTTVGFRTHGTYDDGPFTASFCLACNYGLWVGMPRWLFRP